MVFSLCVRSSFKNDVEASYFTSSGLLQQVAKLFIWERENSFWQAEHSRDEANEDVIVSCFIAIGYSKFTKLRFEFLTKRVA